MNLEADGETVRLSKNQAHSSNNILVVAQSRLNSDCLLSGAAIDCVSLSEHKKTFVKELFISMVSIWRTSFTQLANHLRRNDNQGAASDGALALAQVLNQTKMNMSDEAQTFAQVYKQ